MYIITYILQQYDDIGLLGQVNLPVGLEITIRMV